MMEDFEQELYEEPDYNVWETNRVYEDLALERAEAIAEASYEQRHEDGARWSEALNAPRHGVATAPEFYDHHGQLTTDPRCELGLCRECLDDAFARMEPVPVPSLSPLDPRYIGPDPAYAARYERALAALGIRQRPMDDER